jgi:hypothetical protein
MKKITGVYPGYFLVILKTSGNALTNDVQSSCEILLYCMSKNLECGGLTSHSRGNRASLSGNLHFLFPVRPGKGGLKCSSKQHSRLITGTVKN